MSSIRQDPITGDYVIIAKGRGDRPIAIENEAAVCPFCPGNEHLTPEETYIIKEKGQWSLRAFLNKFPTVHPACGFTETGFYAGGYGHHELLIDTPRHNEQLKDYTAERVEALLTALQVRAAALSKDEKIKYIQIFKNVGQNAGATQPHSHWQMVALPFLPLRQQQMIERAERFYQEHATCMVCDLIKTEQAYQKRIIEENDCFVALASPAAKFMYEVSIFPKNHMHSMILFHKQQLALLGALLQDMIRRIAQLLHDAPYNILIMESPTLTPENRADASKWHWYLQIVPRFGRLAGFELSTGCHINEMEPETAAQSLRML